MQVKRAYNGNYTDHPKPRKRRPTPKQWRKMVATEFEAAPKVVLDGVLCALRQTGQPHLPFQILRPRGDSFQVLDAWAQDDGTLHVREKMSKLVLAVLRHNDEGLTQVPVPSAEEAAPCYAQAAAKHKAIEDLLALPLPPVQRAEILIKRKKVQREMSVLSFAQVYQAGQKALQDGVYDSPLYSASLKIQALERQLLKGTLTPAEIQTIESVLLPQSRQAFIRRVQWLARNGQLSMGGAE